MAQEQFKVGDRVRSPGGRVGTVTAIGNFVHVRCDVDPEPFHPKVLERVGAEIKCGCCGASSWFGGTDADPQPSCGACGALQPGWNPIEALQPGWNPIERADAPPERWGVGDRAHGPSCPNRYEEERMGASDFRVGDRVRLRSSPRGEPLAELSAAGVGEVIDVGKYVLPDGTKLNALHVNWGSELGFCHPDVLELVERRDDTDGSAPDGANNDEIVLAARNYLRCLDEGQTMTGAMSRLRAALAPQADEPPPQRWGVGGRALEDPFDTATVGAAKVGLIFGEHPHSRRDNNIYARFAHGEIVPFDGHRIEIEVRLKTSNYVKRSGLSGDEVRKACSAQLFMNGFPVYTVGGRDAERVLYQIPTILDRLGELPVAIWNARERNALPGRPIFYDHVPCRVERVIWDEGRLLLASEPGFVFAKLDEKDEELRTVIKVDLLSDHIGWSREAKPTRPA